MTIISDACACSRQVPVVAVRTQKGTVPLPDTVSRIVIVCRNCMAIFMEIPRSICHCGNTQNPTIVPFTPVKKAQNARVNSVDQDIKVICKRCNLHVREITRR